MDDESATPTPVRETYDRIAEHFASTREYPWPEVRAFLGDGRSGASGDDSAAHAEADIDAEAAAVLGGGAAPALRGRTDSPAGGRARVGLDLGCGNGRHAELLADRVERVVGIDVSGGLLQTARKRALQRGFDESLRLVQSDAAALPLRDGAVDVAVYVATLHHLRSRERRVASLSELARVLAPDGRALVSVWSTAHDRFDATAGFDTTVEWTLPGGERVPRFYHVYDPEEFASDLAASELSTVGTTVSSGNCYAVVEP
ncbi:methyltransferase domain-containing protein [Halobellus sp. GM3]|uniref:methyltransferase domain-containing protein n=1 Tax=Halobellus sp. GM3 TaxID=3458410 RepID=UPI00403D99EE